MVQPGFIEVGRFRADCPITMGREPELGVWEARADHLGLVALGETPRAAWAALMAFINERGITGAGEIVALPVTEG